MLVAPRDISCRLEGQNAFPLQLPTVSESAVSLSRRLQSGQSDWREAFLPGDDGLSGEGKIKS